MRAVGEQQKRVVVVGGETDEILYKEGRASVGLTKTAPLRLLLIIGIGIGIGIGIFCPSISIGSKFFGASFVISKLRSSSYQIFLLYFVSTKYFEIEY